MLRYYYYYSIGTETQHNNLPVVAGRAQARAIRPMTRQLGMVRSRCTTGQLLVVVKAQSTVIGIITDRRIRPL